MNKNGDLKVWWVPQVPMPPFEVFVFSPKEAKNILNILADYDAFQFEKRIKPDYCNAGGLLIFLDAEWIDWEDEDGLSIDELAMDDL